MSNSTKAVIAIVSIIILISGIFVLTKSRPVENSTSSSSLVSSMSFSSKAVLSSSSQVVSSSSQGVSKAVEVSVVSKIEQTKSEIAILPKTEIVDGVEVTYLNSKNPPQYIKDYLTCDTKDLKNSEGKLTHYGVFTESLDKKITYNCPPKIQDEGCKNNISYIFQKNFVPEKPIINNGYNLVPYKNVWNCDLFNASEVAYPFMVDVCDRFGDNLKIYLNENFDGNPSYNSGGCISTNNITLKSPIPVPEYFHFNKILILK